MRIVMLGPQRRPTVETVVRSLCLDGPIATITAGWQEREPDDELGKQLGSRDVNLSLYGRWLDVQERDPGFAAGERRLNGVLEEVQDIYLLRLDYALQAVYAVQRRSGNDPLRADALAEAVAAVRELDAAHLHHLHRISDVRDEFYQPHARPVIAEHRAAVARLLGDTIRLSSLSPAATWACWRTPAFVRCRGIAALPGDRVVGRRDGADRPDRAISRPLPAGFGHAEIYGRGLGVLRNVVPLPHARARLLLDDTSRMAVFARRFSPARCILLENGTSVDTDSDGNCQPGTRVLAENGRVTYVDAA
jgi:hypothetical protein